MKALVRQELERQDVAARSDRQGLQTLAEKSFYYLTEDEIRRMKEAVTQARPAAASNVVAIRRRRAKRGKLRLERRRCASNLQYGGVPVPHRHSTASARTSRR